MGRKFFAITVACLITLFLVITPGANAEEWEKIGGPWLWMIAPTEEGKGGEDSIHIDSLDKASEGHVTEDMTAQNGANQDEWVGDYQWRVGFIDVDPPGFADVLFGDGNINKTIGNLYGVGDLDDYTSYALITLNSVIEQQRRIGVSSDDAFKIWLNGHEVGFNAVNRSANAKQPQNEFDINLKEGPNLLMVKVSERARKWAMYVSLSVPDPDRDLITLEQTQRIEALPVGIHPLEIETTTTIAIATNTGFYFPKEAVPRLLPKQKFTLFADIRKRTQGFTVETVKFIDETAELREFSNLKEGERELGYTDYVHLTATAHEGDVHTTTPEKPHAHIAAPETPGSYSYKVCVEGHDAAGNKIDDCSEVVITVNAQSDLVVESIEARSADKGSGIDKLSIGQRFFNLHVTVKNQGTEESPHAKLRYYRSANKIISKSDTELAALDANGNHVAAHHNIPPLAPGETVSLSLEVKTFQSAGNQYYGAYVDSSGIDGHTDNNWSEVIELFVFGEVDLQIPDNLISQVAFGSHYTYFVLRALFPKVMTDEGYSIRDCIIGLDLPDVPSKPDRALANNPGYFMYPLETPEHQIGVAQEKKRAQEREEIQVTIGAVAAVAFAIAAAPVAAGAGTLYTVKVGFAVAKGSVALGYVIKTTTDSDISGEEDILVTTADPVLIFRPFIPETDVNWWDAVLESLPDSLYSTNHFSDGAIDVLFLVKSSEVRQNLGITISQTYKLPNSKEQKSATYRGIWNLEETWHLENPGAAAPYARPISLADYPPFQQLPPEVQRYLLKHFGETANAEAWQTPEVTSLLPNYPNPFNPETWIPYQLAKPTDVTLTIYDIQGRVVRDLDLGHQRAGMYHSRSRAAHWDGRNAQGEPVASGLYFYTLKAGDFAATRKMLIRK